jgi:hypothetical protein
MLNPAPSWAHDHAHRHPHSANAGFSAHNRGVTGDARKLAHLLLQAVGRHQYTRRFGSIYCTSLVSV